MQHFYVWHWKHWKRWFVVLTLALVTATTLWFQYNGTLSVFSTDKPSAFSKGNKKSNNIAITFNISWGEKKIHDILKVLKKHQVQATFFVSGEWAERHPDILEDITDDKHELGMLGYRYKSYLDQDIDAVRKDLTYAKEIFDKIGYEKMPLLRTPHGHFNKDIIKLATDMDFQVIHWSLNTHDWKNPGTDMLIDKVMSETSKGDILLFHASDAAKQTAKALETILPGLKNQQYEPVTMSEMMDQAHADSSIVD